MLPKRTIRAGGLVDHRDPAPDSRQPGHLHLKMPGTGALGVHEDSCSLRMISAGQLPRYFALLYFALDFRHVGGSVLGEYFSWPLPARQDSTRGDGRPGPRLVPGRGFRWRGTRSARIRKELGHVVQIQLPRRGRRISGANWEDRVQPLARHPAMTVDDVEVPNAETRG